jgi:hypothetical protein
MRRSLAFLAPLLLAAAPAAAHAQTAAARCASVVDTRCTTLRLDLAAGDAPWALTALTLTLGDGWRFADVGTTTFRGEDDYSYGTPFTGTATVGSPSTLSADFGASPGYTLELGSGGTGWLEFAVDGAGAASVTLRATDPDGGVFAPVASIADAPPAAVTTTPEPAALALVGGGLAALAAAARRRRCSA